LGAIGGAGLNGVTIINAGSITGGAGRVDGAGGAGIGRGGSGSPGTLSPDLDGLTIINSGTITGGAGGIGGDGINGTNLSITQQGGSIVGGSSSGGARANAITFTGGTNTLTMLDGASVTGNVVAASTADTVTFGGSGSNTTDISQYQGFGQFTKTGTGTWTLTGASTATTDWTISVGAISVSSDANLGTGNLAFDGGTLQITGTSFQSTARSITWGANGGGFDIADAANTFTLTQALTGTGGLTKAGAGTLVLAGTNTYSGITTINAGTLQIGNGGTGGSVAGNIVNNAALIFNRLDNSGYGGVISGSGTVEKLGAGTLTLSGVNTYTGATTVNAGTLSVNGSIVASSLTTVNAGATLGGTGTVGNTTINGGTLAPGNSIGLLTVQGNLVLTSAARYMVEVSPTSADRTNVTGTATLGGATVNASFAAGSYITKQYTILNAAGGVIGTFGNQVNTNLPANFTSKLSYDSKNAYLDLTLNYIPPPTPSGSSAPSYSPLNAGQANVAGALEGYFNRNGGIPLVYGGLTANGLTQVSGETTTGSQQTGINAMTQFMGMMMDPSAAGRSDASPVASSFAAADAMAYAPETRSKAPRDAYAAITKAMPRAASFEQRWSVWASGFGGSQTTDGNAAAGSNSATSRIYGAAAGADVWLSPTTLAGISMAGGATSFSVAQGGTGQSDLVQVGGFVRHGIGSAYLSAAFAYGWQDITTERLVTVAGADRLRARFNANSYAGRVELGSRSAVAELNGIGLTPYAAGQVTILDLPAYAETVVSGSNAFALGYTAKTVMAPRTELGLRADKAFALDGALLTLRGRAAWAHDFNTDRAASATFQALPGASFVVNGAAAARDAALTTASAEVAWTNGFALAATFEGEFSETTRSYAGKGVVRYAW
jgi:autotransporter-associated beta strand protein